MTEENYRKAIQDAEQEVVRLTLYRASLDRKLAQLKAAITALSSLLEEPPKADDPTAIGDVGISNAIRQILREAGVGLTPSQVKAKLLESEFDLSKYANSSSVIHNTLKRLELQKEIVPVRDSSGSPAYAVNFARLDDPFEAAKQIAINLANTALASGQFPSLADATGQTLEGLPGLAGVLEQGKKIGGFK
jgi:hypothetical protein